MKLSDKLIVGEPVSPKVIDLFLADKLHSDDWREEAIYAYDFVAGRQWTEAEIKSLKKQKRPPVVFNRSKTVIDAVSGNEIGNRRTVRYIPREMGDVKANEIYTAAGDWFRDRAHADDNETDSFSDMLQTGMGWTESRIDFDMLEEGDPVIDRVDPLEMVWDRNAKKRNIVDAKRLYRFRTVPLDEAQELVGEEFSAEDINAKWTEAQSASDYGYKNRDHSGKEDSKNPEVTIVHMQWIERRTFMEAMDPLSGQKTEFSPEEYTTADKRMKQILGVGLQGREKTKMVRMQAWLGHVVLSVSEAPSQKGFTWNAITGYRDRNTNLWYGMVRSMIDPQVWANKWLSQTMHILNTNAKGGVMVEKGAVEDMAKFEASWSDPTKPTIVKDGALASGRIKEKTAATYPQGFERLMEFGVQSIRDVTGVSLEMLGMREATQASSLEYQRRQSGMTILQPLFDGLKYYRQMQGAVMLDFIQNDLSDGRLIRIVGQGYEKYVPLLKQTDAEYDIIVDDAPTSPNQKEMVWQMFMQLLPTLGKIMPPEFIGMMMKYSPMPSEAVDLFEKMAQKPPDPMQDAMKQLALKGNAAQVQKTEAEAHRAEAQARQAMQPTAGKDNRIEFMKMHTEAARDHGQLEIDGYDAETRRAEADTHRIAAVGALISAMQPPPITSADAPQ
jgi:hypothetical protein